MRSIAFVAVLLMLAGCAGTKKIVEVNKLNGNWVPTVQEMNGAPVPRDFMDNMKLTIADSVYVVSAESMDKGVIRYHGNKMDIYGREGANQGKHFTAIYKYENDMLTICYNLKGDSYPSEFETKGQPMFFISVFKREDKK